MSADILFWDSYLSLWAPDTKTFYYEDLVDDPSPFLRYVAKCLGRPYSKASGNSLKIQRDATTEEWLIKFRKDLRNSEILQDAYPARLPLPTLKNALKVLRRQRTNPHPYLF